MRTTRKQNAHEIGAVRGRRHSNAAPNSLKFMVEVEGDYIDGHVRSANGIRWRTA